MAFITYRASLTPTLPSSQPAVKATPLTNLEVDANFKALDEAKLEKTGSADSLTGVRLTTGLGVTGILPVANGGTGISTSTGSGSVVLSTSPTLVTPILGTVTSGNISNCTSTSMQLVTPVLGTPTSVTLTNAIGLPLTTGVTGVLPAANGGTGATAFTSDAIPYASSTTALTTSNALKYNATSKFLLVNSNASSTPPTVTTGTVLDLHGVDSTAACVGLTSYAGTPRLTFRRANGTLSGTLATIVIDDSLGEVATRSYDGAAWWVNSSASMSFLADQGWSSTLHGSRIVFSTTANTASATPATRLTIANDGLVTVANNAKITGVMSIGAVVERATITAAAPIAVTPFDVSAQAVQYYTSSNTTNFTLNVRGNASTTFSSMLAVGESVSIVLMVTNSTTAYFPNVYQVDGVVTGVTMKWQGGTAPAAGNASSIDMYGFTVLKTGASAYTIFGAQTQFA
jgi:hypothetical protein